MSTKAFESGLRRSLLPGEIRVVQLLPGQWSDDIQCKHLHVFLQEKPDYQALSYVWGARKVSRPIFLNGQQHLVTVNLQSALRHLRHEVLVKVLWIDALCIDQADDDERTAQVGIMGEIYRSASTAIVYLGDQINTNSGTTSAVGASSVQHIFREIDNGGDFELSEQISQNGSIDVRSRKHRANIRANHHQVLDAFCLIRLLASNKHICHLPFGPSEGSPQQKGQPDVFETLRRLMHGPWTPWWYRVWVLQEVVMPSQVIVVHGKVSAPWSMFAKAAHNYVEHVRACCSTTVDSLPRDRLKVLADFSQRLRDIEDLRSHHRVARTETMEYTPLLSLLRRFRSRKATDPRDKAYALLNLATTSVRPDYTLSIPTVFRNTVIDAISNSRSLSVLATDQGRKFRNDLPSWVPDWEAREDSAERFWVEAIDCYNASGQPFDVDRKWVLNGDTLLIDGYCADSVVDVGETMRDDNVRISHDVLEEWFRMLQKQYAWGRELISHKESEQTRPTGPSWSIFCADVIFSQPDGASSQTVRRVTSHDTRAFELWALHAQRSPFRHDREKITNDYTHLLPDKAADPTLSNRNMSSTEGSDLPLTVEDFNLISMMDASIMSAAMNRKLFITANGHVGLGPAGMQPGHGICLAKGSRAPFILRTKPWSDQVISSQWGRGTSTMSILTLGPEHPYRDSIRTGLCSSILRIERLLRSHTPEDQKELQAFRKSWKILVPDRVRRVWYHPEEARRSLPPAEQERLRNNYMAEIKEWWPDAKALRKVGLEFHERALQEHVQKWLPRKVLRGIETLLEMYYPLVELVGACYLHNHMDPRNDLTWETIGLL